MAKFIQDILRTHQEKRPHAGRDLKNDFIELVEAIVAKHRQDVEGPRAPVGSSRAPVVDQRSRPWRTTPLGEYLLQAAKVYAALDIEPDLRLVADYLFHNPPLHPRRTLFQSLHYSKVDVTSRDEN